MKHQSLFSKPTRVLLTCLTILSAASQARAVVGTTITDDFNTAHNYLANGVSGTVWSGLYTAAGNFPGGNTGFGPGSTLAADASITGAGVLTVRSTQGGWNNAEDDGFFLFMNAPQDFQMSVHVISPFDITPYNMAGLMVRAAGPGGAPLNGTENWLSLTYFGEFNDDSVVQTTSNNITAMLTTPSTSTNFWLRMDRVNGTTFNFYHKAQEADAWQLITGTPIERPDLAGLPLQAGLIQWTATSGSVQAQFDDFSITLVPEPGGASIVGLGLAAGLARRRGSRVRSTRC